MLIISQRATLHANEAASIDIVDHRPGNKAGTAVQNLCTLKQNTAVVLAASTTAVQLHNECQPRLNKVTPMGRVCPLICVHYDCTMSAGGGGQLP